MRIRAVREEKGCSRMRKKEKKKSLFLLLA